MGFKLVLTADLHLRPESADTVFEVLERVLKLAVEHKPSAVAILGDLWHVRYAIPVDLLNRFDAWTKRAKAADVPVVLLAGNHDQVDVSGQNALQVYEHDNCVVISEPRWFFNLAWLPYDRDVKRLGETAARMLSDFRKSGAKGPALAFIHQGLVGAVMNSGIVAAENDGLGPAEISGFDHVFMGHWHRHQTVGNATYCGSPWQTRADEAGQQKGVILLDLEPFSWRFEPFDVGQHFFNVNEANDVAGVLRSVRKGDIVRVQHEIDDGIALQLKEEAHERGAEVFFVGDVGSFSPRLGVGLDAPLRVHAERFLSTQGLEAAKQAQLLALFDEVMGKVGGAS